MDIHASHDDVIFDKEAPRGKWKGKRRVRDSSVLVGYFETVDHKSIGSKERVV